MAESPEKERPSLVRRSRRFALGLLFLLFLGYGGWQVISRTDGFRLWVAERLSAFLGEPVRIGRCRATLPPGLDLRDIEAGELRAGRIVLSFRFPVKGKSAIARVRIEKPEGRFVRDAAARAWRPHGLSSWIDAAARIAGHPADAGESEKGYRFPPPLLAGTAWTLSGASFSWVDASGNEAAAVSGGELRSEPLGTMRDTTIDCRRLRLFSGRELTRLHGELAFFRRPHRRAVLLVLDLRADSGRCDPFSSTEPIPDLAEAIEELARPNAPRLFPPPAIPGE